MIPSKSEIFSMIKRWQPTIPGAPEHGPRHLPPPHGLGSMSSKYLLYPDVAYHQSMFSFIPATEPLVTCSHKPTYYMIYVKRAYNKWIINADEGKKELNIQEIGISRYGANLGYYIMIAKVSPGSLVIKSCERLLVQRWN